MTLGIGQVVTMTTEQDSQRFGTLPSRVVIAGGGVAGLETLMALRALAGARVELTLVAPHDEFVYRPLAVDEPFAVGRARRIPLDDAARAAGATFITGTIDAVDAGQRIVTPSDSRALEYDALVLAVGAEAVPAVAHAMTWDDRSDSETLGGLLRDIEEGYSRRLAVVIPPGPAWPLRAYELALVIALEARGMSADLETTIVAPDPSPLELLGPRAVELVSDELARAGVDVVSAAYAEVEAGHAATVVLHPSGSRLEVDRVLALPGLRGRPITGIPADADGFLEVDEHGRLRGLDGVWGVGDATAFALKSGGFAAEQADVAAADIAAAAGADVEPRSFDPGAREQLAGLPAGPFLKAWLAEGDDDGLTTGLPATGVPTLTYLQRDLAASWRGRP
jgi:sulfide:quinone oxidoreductase